ncbi:putative aflatoxin biosynthesis ketoreductase nor-1 [Arthroderma uncinatum]|uniref:putative aflatoxin biosynthesis ketoreductase nor-1 n=1 Tax=Arthroderma uncinatum TaxID=74035 RepID=UPI00144ABCC9|nr:putative aflatoxin biosynthesis ketoreductase nor-1 [Arthroderma uncinatum]KAF3490690.1 putative aflatoxin biosynthesis ketoreductase nor-1 [Arthroderma uncinatum]
MAPATVVLITGAGRGIGQALTEAYLLRPNHTVIATVRDCTDPKYDALKKSPVGSGSRLLLVSIESTSNTDPEKAVEQVKAAGVDHIDVVIANAGVAPPSEPFDTLDVNDLTHAFQVNTVSTVVLYQAVKPLLEKSAAPKWMSISSAAGSITRLEIHQAHGVAAYGSSKAAQNFFTQSQVSGPQILPAVTNRRLTPRALHSKEKNLIAFAIHPGLVQTEMGNAGARAMGMEQAPDTIGDSVMKSMNMIDAATRENTSGKFYNVIDSSEIPW